MIFSQFVAYIGGYFTFAFGDYICVIMRRDKTCVYFIGKLIILMIISYWNCVGAISHNKYQMWQLLAFIIRINISLPLPLVLFVE